MTNDIFLDKDLTRILDILEQIKAVNKMIALHQEQSKDEFMVRQYQDRKYRFLEELKVLLSDYEIEVLIKRTAA